MQILDLVIFPVLPIVLMVACLAVVWWALQRMAPLGTTPVLRTAPPAARPAYRAPVAAAVAAPERTLAAAAPAPELERAVAQPAVAEPPADILLPAAGDLTIVEGIGPKIAAVLKAAGITTLSSLAETPLARIQQVLTDADLHLARPETWPEQARLAAAGRLDALKELQDSLRAGRRA